MKKIEDYILATEVIELRDSDAYLELRKQVIRRINDGYYPSGSISILTNNYNVITLIQPMIKYKKDNNN